MIIKKPDDVGSSLLIAHIANSAERKLILMAFAPMPGINEDSATTLLPVPPNKPKKLSPRSLMALRSRRFAPSLRETQENAGPGFFDELCNSQQTGSQILPSLVQLQAFHKHKSMVRERLHGSALCWGRQEEREMKLHEMLPHLHDIFECEQDTADEAEDEPSWPWRQYQVKEADTDKLAHIHVEDGMAAKSDVVISDIA
ncbi:unnamed protein product [Symbiodinium sp. CCMP2592]|nr:unnamed protein product [Symbiodinium sp. CCMP2592]